MTAGHRNPERRPDVGEADTLSLSNEYAHVIIHKKTTSKGERVEIRSPKLGYRIELDPVELESLTWQEKSVFSTFLSTPFGPDE